MAQTLPSQYRRELFADRSSANYQVPEESSDPVELDKQNQSEQYRRRLLDRFRKTDSPEILQEQMKKQIKAEAEKRVREFAAKSSLRVFNIACSATLVLIIVTYITWTIQIIVGNLLGNPLVPKLSGLEMGLWGIVSLLLFALIIMIIAILALGVRMFTDPLFMVKELWDSLTDMFQNLLQTVVNKIGL